MGRVRPTTTSRGRIKSDPSYQPGDVINHADSHLKNGSAPLDLSIWYTKPKRLDEVRNNTTTLAKDAELSIVFPSLDQYLFRFFLRFGSSTGTPDIKMAVFAHAGGNAPRGTYAYRTDTAADAVDIFLVDLQGDQSFTSTATDYAVIIEGYVDPNSGSGIELWWAQNTATVEDTILKSGSYLQILRVPLLL